MRRTTTMATLAAICTALAIAPPLAGAEKRMYEGPIDLAKNPGFVTGADGSMIGPFRSYTPTIQLKVKFEGKTPTGINKLKAFGLYGPCSGRGISDGETKDQAEIGPKVRKNGRFFFNDPLESFTVTGRIPPKGPATGTVRKVVEYPFEPASNGFDSTYGTCDSGVLSWTATRTSRLSTTDDL